ncbi:MAG: hypothetical protein ACI4S3_00840 [Candidatus Gastranaerophilaceae bacterium]
MTLGIQKFNSRQNVFENTTKLHRTEIEVEQKKKTLMQLRYKRDEKVAHVDKIKSITGAGLGAAIPMLLLAKAQKKSPWNMQYRLKEVISMSVGANLGAIGLTSINKPDKEKIKKRNEGIFQVFNSVLPMALVDGSIKVCEKFKKLNNAPAKIAASVLGIFAGTQSGIHLANKITDPKDLQPDRKYSVKDSIANLDDAVGILVLGKVPFADKIKIGRVLPFIYTYSGYRSGTSN